MRELPVQSDFGAEALKEARKLFGKADILLDLHVNPKDANAAHLVIVAEGVEETVHIIPDLLMAEAEWYVCKPGEEADGVHSKV